MARGAPSHREATLFRDTAAATSVIATISMVATVVVLAGAALWMSLSFANTDSTTPAYSGLVMEPREEGTELHMQMLAGTAVPITGTKLILTADGARSEFPLGAISTLAQDIYWPVGESLCIVGPGSGCLVASASQVEVVLVIDGQVIYREARNMVPFVFSGSGIQVLCAGPVTYEIIHVNSDYGFPATPLAVNVSLSDDGGSNWEDLWAGPLAGGETHTEPLVAAGSLITARGQGQATGLDATYQSHPSDPHVFVGLDGDMVPSVLAFGGPAGVQDAVEPFVNFLTGRINIEANQAIVLWEFDPAILSASADYQDLVLLLTLPSAGC